MDIHELEGRLAAIEVLLFSSIMQLDAIGFKHHYREQKEAAIVGLLGNSSVSDRMRSSLEERLAEYEEKIGISDPDYTTYSRG